MNMFLKLTQIGEDNDTIIINVDRIVYIEKSTEYTCCRVAITDGDGRNLIVAVKDNIEDIYELLKIGNRMIVEENGKMKLL